MYQLYRFDFGEAGIDGVFAFGNGLGIAKRDLSKQIRLIILQTEAKRSFHGLRF